jgi:hypothetical protein
MLAIHAFALKQPIQGASRRIQRAIQHRKSNSQYVGAKNCDAPQFFRNVSILARLDAQLFQGRALQDVFAGHRKNVNFYTEFRYRAAA